MNLVKRKRRIANIPLSSTSDIGFLLLIFIMLVSLINYRKEVKIQYAEATLQEVVNAEKNFEIWIDRNGNIFYDGKNVTTKQLEGFIVDAVLKKPHIRIHILSDKDTEYKYINDVVDILKLLQHRTVSFVVKENKR